MSDIEKAGQQIVEHLLEDKPRFFVFEPRKEYDAARGQQSWAYRAMKVLDRARIENGQYVPVAEDLQYLDALRLAKELNAAPDRVEEIVNNFHAEMTRPSQSPGREFTWRSRY